MDINGNQDYDFVCTHCEGGTDDIDDGIIAIHINLGYGTVYTVCSTCAKNLVS